MATQTHTPVIRVHMVDACRQTLDERADRAQRIGDFIAGLIIGGIVFGALTAIVVALAGVPS